MINFTELFSPNRYKFDILEFFCPYHVFMTNTESIPPAPHMGVVVKRARKELHLTLEKLAKRCGVSKSMLSQIERGQVNPTFSVVWNLTQALGLDLNLLGEQSIGEAVIEHTHSYSTPTMKSADGSCTLRLLSPAHTVMSVEWYEVIMEPEGCLDSRSHGAGTYEHFTCQKGSVRIVSGKQIADAVEGDTLRYYADRPHRIINTCSGVASGLLLVALPGQCDSSVK